MSAVSTHLATVALATLLVSGVPTAPLSAEAQEGVEVETTEQTYFGAPVNMGEGVARVVVRTDGAGDPEALGVEFTDGLPQERAEDRSLGWHRFLAHVNEMGLHTVPKDALELHGEPPALAAMGWGRWRNGRVHPAYWAGGVVLAANASKYFWQRTDTWAELSARMADVIGSALLPLL